uniref:Transmembrane channel-like protein 6 n=1 Tax=Phallusia mammillata TaxID=59560 RepID=A0A6F9DV05_9ASCI|nr:transmembrane channel-like protein 6 [Phallusia mammillata]
MASADEDFDQILNSLDGELNEYETNTPDGYSQDEHAYDPDFSTYQRPYYGPDHHLHSNDLADQNGANQTLMRNRMKNAKELYEGIEDTMMELPSRTLGRRGGAHVKDAANHFGTLSRNTFSRRFGRSTLRRQRLASHEEILRNETNLANDIYTEMKDSHGEVKSEELRELPMNMGIKRKIKSQALAHRQDGKNKNVGCFKIWKYKMSMKWRHFKERTKKTIGSAKLWEHHLKQVEGNFGSGVGSYFTFLRGLFLLSIPSFVLNFAFITIPQIIEPVPRTNPDVQFTGEEILTGANWLTETIMYYGYYTNQLIQTIPGVYYDMPLAYLLATAGYFLLCLILLVKSTASNFRQSFVDKQEDRSNFISKVFCSWDFGITSATAAKLQHRTIKTELQEILSERKMATQKRSACEKFEVYAFRIVTWAIFLGLTAGSMALVYFLESIFIEEIKCNLSGVAVLPEIALALIVSTINLIMPIIFNAITVFEKYKYPRHQLYVAVFRNFLLKMGLLAVICAFWTASDLIQTPGSKNDTKNCSQNVIVDCWETDLGQEAYRLVIIDFLFSIIFSTFCAEFLRKIFATYCCEGLKQPEFSIVNNVMDLIYGQTLCWIGVFFSPLLALIVTFKYFLMFYIKKISVMQNCVPPSKRWRAAQTRTIFNFLLLLSFLLSAAFLCVVVFRLTPSESCGPYRGLPHTYDVIVTGIDDLAGNKTTQWLAGIITFVGSVWFLDAVVAGLAVAVAINHATSKGYRALSEALRGQIKLEGKDKALLLTWLQNVSKQANQFNNFGGPGPSGNINHVVPILSRHRDSINSAPSSRGGSVRGNPPQSVLTASDVLTHVDPHHLQSGNLAHMELHQADSESSHRSVHKDPLLRQALHNQQQQPYMDNPYTTSQDPAEVASSYEASLYQQQNPAYQHQHYQKSNSASPSPVAARRQHKDPLYQKALENRSQQRPSSMFVGSSKYAFEASSSDSDDESYSIPAWKKTLQQQQQRPSSSQEIEMSQIQNTRSSQMRPQSYYMGQSGQDDNEMLF